MHVRVNEYIKPQMDLYLHACIKIYTYTSLLREKVAYD